MGDARDGKMGIAYGLQQLAIFAADVQSANRTALSSTSADVGRQQIGQGSLITEGRNLIHPPLVDLLGNLCTQRNVRDTFTQWTSPPSDEYVPCS